MVLMRVIVEILVATLVIVVVTVGTVVVVVVVSPGSGVPHLSLTTTVKSESPLELFS